VRVCPYGVHVIIYTANKTGGLLIIRVRHGREDWL
jgi:plasmid stabilization system protein ParE